MKGLRINLLGRKFILLLSLIFISLSSIAFSEKILKNVGFHFDRPSYAIGDNAKVKVILRKRPTNSDFEYFIEGTQIINGNSDTLSFRQHGNIFEASTNPLGENSSIRIRLTLVNKKKIEDIKHKIETFKDEIKQLKDNYTTNPDSELLNQISDLEFKIKSLKIERSKNIVFIKEFYKQIKISGSSEGPQPDDEPERETPISNIEISLEGIDENNFNPINLSLKLKTTSEVGFNLTGIKPYFVLNGESLDVENVLVSKNEIFFSLKAFEGRNVLNIVGLDAENNFYSFEASFYSGSKDVSVNIANSSNSGTLSTYLATNQDFKISTNFSGSNVNLQNVPNLPVVVDVHTEGNEFAFQMIDEDSAVTSVIVLPNDEPSTIINDEFSLGAEGWNITSSGLEIINREINGQPVPNNSDLKLTDTENSGIEVKRTFLAGQAQKFVTFKFNIHSQSDDEEIHVVMRNITTGEVSHRVFNGKNFKEGPSKLFDVDQNISVIAERENDVISLHLKTISRAKKNKKKLPLKEHKSKLVANLILTLNGIFYESFEIQRFYAHNIFGNIPKTSTPAYTTNLNTLSVGFLPFSNFAYKIPFNFQFRKIDETTTIRKVELIVEQPWVGQEAGVWMRGTWEPSPGEAEDLSESNNRRNLPNNPGDSNSNRYNYFKEYVRDAIEKISFKHSDVARFINHSRPLKLYLAIYLDNGELHYADLGRSLTPLEYRSSETHPILKFYFESREPTIGGDSWGQKFVWDLLTIIFEKESNSGFQINDLSRMQGGHFDNHEWHREGLDVDYFINNFYEKPSDTQRRVLDKGLLNSIKLLSATKTSGGDSILKFVKEVLISIETGEKLVTVEENGETKESWKSIQINELTDLKREQRAGCTIDNRTTKTVVRHAAGHVSHGHFVFKKIPTAPFPSERFYDFQPYHRRDENDHRVFDFEATSSESHGNEQYIWDIRKANDNSIVEVIDVSTLLNSSSTRGTLISKVPNLSYFRYRFPNDGKYKVNLVVARNFSDDSNNPDERCISQSFEIHVKADNIVNCEGEWQTPRGREAVDPASGHKHLGGALVSKDTDFRAGRFFVEDDTSAICKESVIVDGFTDSEGCTEENKYSCASILFRGLVGVINSKIDATQGRVQIAGTNQPFIGYPMISPTNPENGVGNDYNATLITDSIILPKGDDPIVIINSDIDGDGGIANIRDSAFIQQANVWWSTVSDNVQIKGGTVSGTRNPEFAFDPAVTVGGSSVVRGFVGSESRLDIQDSIIEAPSIVSGGGLINRSLLEGGFFGSQINPSEFESVRIAKLDNSAIINGSSMGVRAHVLNETVIGAEEDDPNWVSGISENVTVKDGAWVFGWSSLMGEALITGNKVKAKNIWARDKVVVDSSVGGTKPAMVLNGNIDLSNDTKVYGTPEINFGHYANTYISDDVILNNIQANNTRFTDQVNGTNSWVYGQDVSVSGQATFVSASILERAKLSGTSRVIDSTIKGTANISGTAQVLNRCTLTSGSYSSGIYSGETAPCEPWLPARNLASNQKTFTANYSAFRNNCGSEKLFKSIKSDKKRKSLRNFSRLCNDTISHLEKRKFQSVKMNLEDMLSLERFTRDSISKRMKGMNK